MSSEINWYKLNVLLNYLSSDISESVKLMFIIWINQRNEYVKTVADAVTESRTIPYYVAYVIRLLIYPYYLRCLSTYAT